jgi:hypothetical protein
LENPFWNGVLFLRSLETNTAFVVLNRHRAGRCPGPCPGWGLVVPGVGRIPARADRPSWPWPETFVGSGWGWCGAAWPAWLPGHRRRPLGLGRDGVGGLARWRAAHNFVFPFSSPGRPCLPGASGRVNELVSPGVWGVERGAWRRSALIGLWGCCLFRSAGRHSTREGVACKAFLTLFFPWRSKLAGGALGGTGHSAVNCSW